MNRILYQLGRRSLSSTAVESSVQAPRRRKLKATIELTAGAAERI